jgi:glutamyl-tRNA synthetase
MSALADVADFNRERIEKAYQDLAQSEGIAFGEIIHPTRLAVSGVSFGPGLFELMEVLGKEAALRRMRKAVEVMRKDYP